jgi:hypothetical protein
MLSTTHPRISEAQRLRFALRLALGLYVLLGLGQGLHFWDLNLLASRGPDLCLFHRYFGIDCPGCGMGRALILLLQGRFRDAWAMHPFAPLVLAGASFEAFLPLEILARIRQSKHWLLRGAPGMLLVLLLIRWAVHILL